MGQGHTHLREAKNWPRKRVTLQKEARKLADTGNPQNLPLNWTLYVIATIY